jgi:hypothetical protein
MNAANFNPLFKNLSGWQSTGNRSVDAVADAVWKARKSIKPLRSISLKPGAYEMFILFAIENWGIEHVLNERGEVDALVEFDGVEILRGSSLQIYNMAFDYWPAGQKQADKWRDHKDDKGYYPEHNDLKS